MYESDLVVKANYSIVFKEDSTLSFFPYFGMDTQQKQIFLYNTKNKKETIESLLWEADLTYWFEHR